MIRNIVKTEQVSYLLKWTILCTVVGGISGIIIAIYTKFVMGATTMRLDYPALILGLPITGFVMSAVYDKVSRGRLLGNNVLISGIKGRREHVSLFMIPLVIMGTAWTHLCGAL